MTVTKSTQVITDLGTMQSTTPTSATDTLAHVYGMDIAGMIDAANESAAQLKETLTLIAAKCDSADPNLAVANNLLAVLV